MFAIQGLLMVAPAAPVACCCCQSRHFRRHILAVAIAPDRLRVRSGDAYIQTGPSHRLCDEVTVGQVIAAGAILPSYIPSTRAV